MPIDPALSGIEEAALNVLMDPEAGPADRTTQKIAERVGVEPQEMGRGLRSLERRDLVRREVDQGLGGLTFWMTTAAAADL